MTEIDYKNAYEALIVMWRHDMKYDISRLVEGEGYDGCLLTGDHFYLKEFAGFVKKYGYDTIEMIVRDVAEDKPDEVSDQ